MTENQNSSDFKIYDNFLDAFIIIDGNCRVVYFNDMFLNATGLSRNLVSKTKSINNVVSFSDIDKISKEELENWKEYRGYKETELFVKGEKHGSVILNVIHEPKGGEDYWLLMFRDSDLEKRLQTKYKRERKLKNKSEIDLEKAHEELEKYSSGLENALNAKTKELQELNEVQNIIISSLSEAFLIYNKAGELGPYYSEYAENLFQKNPVSLKVWELLDIPAYALNNFIKWWSFLFEEPLDFEDIRTLGIKQFINSEGRFLRLDFLPKRNDQGKIESIVLTAYDMTSEQEALDNFEHEQQHAKMILQIAKNKNHFQKLLKNIKSFSEEVAQYKMAGALNEAKRTKLLQNLHTLKGDVSIFFIDHLVEFIHDKEELLKGMKCSDRTFRRQFSVWSSEVSSYLDNTIEKLCNDFEIQDWAEADRLFELSDTELFNIRNELLKIGDKAQPLIDQLDEKYLKEPIEELLRPMMQMAQDTANKLGKTIAPIEIETNDIKLPPGAYDKLFSSLIHAVRNAIDHGIEPTKVREENGKDPMGRIWIRCQIVDIVEGNERLAIEIGDDGAGVNVESLKDKLNADGVDIEAISDSQLLNTLLINEFSLTSEKSEISGLGVGLSAIAQETKELGGEIELVNKPGEGFSIFIYLPFDNEVSQKVA